MLKSIRLKFTEQGLLELPTTGITIFVGPNSSGKSLILREIESIFFNDPLPVGTKILSDYDLSWKDEDVAVGEVVEMAALVDQPAHYGDGVYNIGNVTIPYGRAQVQINIQMLRGQHRARVKTWWATNILRWGVIRLDGRSRFNLTDDQGGGDLLTKAANSLGHLFRDEKDRKRVQALVYDAFKLHYVVDPTNLGQLRIRMSEAPPMKDEQSLNADARAYYKKAIHIKDASDGVQAYVGIATALLSGDFSTVLIDEPEAFLHPPLARKLGKHLAQLATEREGSLFAATHSAEFLMGCVQASKEVRVVRLEYSGGKSRARIVDPAMLEDFLKRPIMRSANVVSALFYDGVIVTESDNDRAFYSEIYYRISRDDAAAPSILFVNAQNKQTIKDIVGPLRRFGVPAVAAVDIDILKDGGKVWTDWLKAAHVPEGLHAGYQANRDKVKKFFESAGLEMKSGGTDLLNGGDLHAANELLDSMEKYGIFAVRRGELERWLPDLGAIGKKSDWTVSMFEKLGSDENLPGYVKAGVGDVWAFMRGITAWVSDAGRKGME